MSLNQDLALISDENRTNIIQILKTGEVCVCDLAQKLGIEQSLLSHHLSKLKNANLVVERRVGRWVHYSLNKEEFRKLEESYIELFGAENISTIKCSLHSQCCKDCNCEQ